VPLVENDLFGPRDKVAIAFERLRTFEPPEGYYVAISGGKDSTVIYDLCHRSGCTCRYYHSLTTLDAPETVHFIRQHHPDAEIRQPKMPLLRRMEQKGVMPLRGRAWCCDDYKERKDVDGYVVMGVRTAESRNRSKRRVVEACYRRKRTQMVNIILDWTERDVWAYIRGNSLPYNPLYDDGFTRVGCVLCPKVRHIDRQRERFPKLYEAWHRAALRTWDNSESAQRTWDSGEAMWQWWLDRDAATICDEQTTLFE